MGNVKAPTVTKRTSMLMKMASSSQRITRQPMFTTPIVLPSYCGDESAAYAGSVYRSQSHDQWLAERSIDNRVIKRAYRNMPLDEKSKKFNQQHFVNPCSATALKVSSGFASSSRLRCFSAEGSMP
ncbi:MAG: hypothetical protein QS721_02840 [Candidatus Endonucleobacter sp. (ex Gigantidas childressi)]|nr:hypothetical protein [Candidatus Endonucleobacter sp. (ex Gigantidas childressi)]